ncbi:SDR family NAD(P)-dependent oxidoreductase [Bradyrhizobium sp. NP1]|uniref:SDR family NAD(P)-dependent oxidoreductase n=1 Tax=Bradyrhizobium sp. NP1 TaxID=3049772 RepID=UPI0025A5E59E|nr:SDR family NAD(P)-dependent oxidoreductase [Bradyrhizobium sp. NP1]WJR75869.1 SDR family NAD(P)-dependent oxidoreductase [Bradyrhizobium sp. NP1]
MELNLKDRVAVVTGGAAGIGEAIARALAHEGCKLCILDRDENAARRTAESLGNGALSSAVDVSNADLVSNALEKVAENHGRIDVLVNAAGVLSTGFVADLPVTEWQRVSQVNLAGIVYCVKAAIPAMKKQNGGRIINIASVSAERGGGSVGNTLYGATKAGVVALTKGLARELGPDKITVNAIAPAIADTAMTHKLLTDDALKKILARIPIGRLAALSDIADLAVFLASDRANFITGATIPVDGGILTT